MVIATFLWFSAVAFLLSHHKVLRGFRKIQHIVDRIFGAVLIGLGIKVALSTAK
jgi:threonine/homoserine/homoserine lactone efflux protein